MHILYCARNCAHDLILTEQYKNLMAATVSNIHIHVVLGRLNKFIRKIVGNAYVAVEKIN